MGEIENGLTSFKIVDILSSRALIHWAPLKDLRKILDRGVYSPRFARRINDKEYEVHTPIDFERFIWLTNQVEYGDGQAVGILVDEPNRIQTENPNWSFVPLRIAPRQFLGLILPKKFVVSSIKYVEERLNQDPVRILPIYDSSGSLCWPRRMSHEEIVQMLGKK